MRQDDRESLLDTIITGIAVFLYLDVFILSNLFDLISYSTSNHGPSITRIRCQSSSVSGPFTFMSLHATRLYMPVSCLSSYSLSYLIISC